MTTKNDDTKSRNGRANEILKASIRGVEESAGRVRGWRTIDFIEEDRFLHEIKGDPKITDDMTAEELAEYAEEQIYS